MMLLKFYQIQKLKILKKDDADYRTYVASFKKLKKLFPHFKFKKHLNLHLKKFIIFKKK